MTADAAAAFALLRTTSFVSLTTFRRNGERVATAVWLASDGPDLVVTTMLDTGKVKRIRNNPAVDLVPCSRSGKVTPGLVAVPGVAEIITDPAEIDRLRSAFLEKYGLQFRIFTFIERIIGRRKPKTPVILRISRTD